MKNFLKNHLLLNSTLLITFSTILYILFQNTENKKDEKKSVNISNYNLEEFRQIIYEFFIENSTFYC